MDKLFNRLYTLKIADKIFILIFIITLSLLITGLTGLHYTGKAQKSISNIYNKNLLPIEWFNDARNQNRAIEADIYKAIFAENSENKIAYINDIKRRISFIDTLFTNYANTDKTQYAENKFRELNVDKNKETKLINRTVLLIKENRKNEALHLFRANQPLFDKYANNIRFMAKYNATLAKWEYKQNLKDARLCYLIILSTMITGLSLTIVQGLLIAVISYQLEKAKDKETLLKTIIADILTSSDIEKAYHKIASQLAKVVNVDRSSLRLYDPLLGNFSDVVGEYRRTKSIPSIKTVKNIYPKDFIKLLNEELVEKKTIFIISNASDPIYSKSLRAFFKDISLKSAALVPILFKDKIIAAIFLTNTESYKIWSKSEISLLNSVAQQVALAINLFKLADESNRSLQTERTLRKIITTARQSENLDQLFDYVLENITQIFDVDRSLHLQYDADNVYVINENIKDKRLISLKNEILLNKKKLKELAPNILHNTLIINDINTDIQNTELKNYLLKNEITSFIIYPIGNIYPKKIEENPETMMICSKKSKIWTSNEINAFKLIIAATTLVYQEIKQRKESEQLKQSFLATLTHDLKSPLHGEQKALEAILAKKFGISLENYSEYLESIYKTNEELLLIVDNILSVYHYEAGKFKLKLEEINLTALINQSVSIMKPLAIDKDSKINLNIEPDIFSVTADRNETLRVINNILSNAIKHNKNGTNIIIAAKNTDNEVEVSVHDDGAGIPESERPDIFQRYPTTKRKIGSGLGLYLSKQIIEAHKGKIWFETEEEKGTTFYFTIPVSEA